MSPYGLRVNMRVFFFLENFSVALWTLKYFCLLLETLNRCFSITCDAKPFKYLNI